MTKIGVIGEDPNDADSIINLLSKRFPDVRFKKLAKGVTGCQLDTKKLYTSIKRDLMKEEFSQIIYIRDLDGFSSESDKRQKLDTWFTALNKEFGEKGIFLLNIWELEALILADIATFNKLYRISHQFSKDPTMQDKPKETLKRLTRQGSKVFHENHCPEVFKHLDIDTVEKNCGYFKSFLAELKAAV